MNLTPCGACALMRPRFAPRSTVSSRRGATLLASLESELSDSASLRYLRRRSLCELRRRSSKSLLLHQKRKSTVSTVLFWRRRRDLNSRAGKTRPTPLAGAPLRPLEYFSIADRRFLICPTIISSFFGFVNSGFEVF